MINHILLSLCSPYILTVIIPFFMFGRAPAVSIAAEPWLRPSRREFFGEKPWKKGRFIGWPWKNMARILQHLDFYQVLQGNVVFFQ